MFSIQNSALFTVCFLFAVSMDLAYGQCVPDPNAWYRIENRHSHKIIDGTPKSDKYMQVQQWEYNKGLNQHWKFQNLTTGEPPQLVYAIFNRLNNKAMGVVSRLDFGDVLEYEFQQKDNQLWIIKEFPEGYCVLENVFSKKVLDLPGWWTHNGLGIQQWSLVDAATNVEHKLVANNYNQQWKLVQIEEQPLNPVVQ
jgi:hypothetical protein